MISPDVTIYRAPAAEGDGLSRTRLAKAVSLHTGLDQDKVGTPAVTPLGKPYFPALPELHCSVTHSGGWWLCACAAQPVGLDLQVHRSHAAPQALSRRFFHPLEDQWLAREDYRSFFSLWCAKESWVKYTGRGFFDGPESFHVVSPAGEFPRMEEVELRLLPFEEGYSLCLCARQIGQVRFRDL